jgi:MFS transporter, OFA family, oxalate/formate antiporter
MKKTQITMTFAAFFAIMLLLGSVYTYSVYRPFIIQFYNISLFESGLPYMASLAVFAVSMTAVGRVIQAQNIKKLLLLGSGFLSSGFLLSALAPNIWLFTLGYGGLVGIGVGIVYALALNIIPRIYTERIGLMSGLVLMAFGLSSSIVSPIAQSFLSNYSLQAWFLLFAVGTLVFANVPSLFLQLKPDAPRERVESKGVLFFILFFTMASFVGLMIIGISAFIGTTVYNFDGGTVALLVSLFALGNAGARPVFGYLVDKIGFLKSSYIINALIVAASLFNLLNQGSNIAVFGFGYFLYWVSLGAWLAMMPLLTKRIFGTEQYASAYGKVYLGYGIAAILGTLFSGVILDLLGGPEWIYLGIILFAVVIAAMSFYIQKTYLRLTKQTA